MKKPTLDQYDEETISEIKNNIDMGAMELSEHIEHLFQGRMNKIKKKQLNELILRYNTIVGFKAYKLVS